MAHGDFIPIKLPPGVVLVDSKEATQGRFTMTQWVRWIRALPEKIGGFAKLNATPFVGRCRGMRAWNTNFGRPRYALGTHKRFYVAEDGIEPVDRTPRKTTTMLTNAFSVTNGSATVTVAHTAHGLLVGRKIILRGEKHTGGGLIGGLDLDGVWTVATVPNANSYTFTHTAQATATAGPAGGKVYHVYPRVNPFTTVAASRVVTVAWAAHGLIAGGEVVISEATAVGGLTLNGIFRIGTVPNANSFTIRADTPATSSTTGGGPALMEGLLDPGPLEAIRERGYGEGYYGEGPYGPPDLSSDAAYLDPRSWALDKWGEDLLASPYDGGIWYYDTSRPGPPTRITEAPARARFMFVTPERIVHALGIDGDPMNMAWCDQGNLVDWVASATDQANQGRRLQEGSTIIAGAALDNGVNLIWTDTAVYVHQYVGSGLVYDTRIAPGGRGNGLVGPQAFVVAGQGGAAYWISQTGFRMYQGSPQPIPNAVDVERWIYEQMDLEQRAKAIAVYNPLFNEVWFFFAREDQAEPSAYAMVQLDGFIWSYGELERTAGASFEKGRTDILMAGADGYVYQHEVGKDADGEPLPWLLRFGPVGSGGMELEIVRFDPDFQRVVGNVTVGFRSYDREQDQTVDSVDDIYTPGESFLEPRISGRWHEITLSGDALGSDFRLGVPQMQPARLGRRP